MRSPDVDSLLLTPDQLLLGTNQASRQAKRTTKTSHKLTLFPATATSDETERRDFCSALQRISLPRVTAKCTASTYRMDSLLDFLQKQPPSSQTAPKMIDECIYTTLHLDDQDDPVDPQEYEGIYEQNGDSTAPIANVSFFLVLKL